MSNPNMVARLPSMTTCEEILRELRKMAAEDKGINPDYADSFCMAYLAEYVAALHRDAAKPELPPLPLTDSEVNELLISVSLTRLEQIVAERRLQDGRCTARLERDPGRRCLKDIGHLTAHDYSRVSTDIEKDNEL